MKEKLYKLYGILNSLKYPKELFASVRSIFDEEVLDNKTHLYLAADWLLYMQNSDGGYARKFSFLNGRDKSYIETTGYIIETLLKLDKEKYINSALKAGEWLLSIQNEDGSFSEIDTNKPFVFDTGQVLIGLNSLYKFTKEEKYKNAIKKAGEWLVKVQEEDGSWEKYAYNKEKHTYYTRVAAALYEAGEILENEEFKTSALKNINWVLDNQKENGFFKYASFLESIPPYLHTIVYILEGLIEIYEKNKDERILKAVLKNANKLKEVGFNRDLILCSQYNENFKCVNKEKCVTGLAQWAGVSIRIYEIIKDNSFLESGAITLFYLKAKQLKTSFMKGGFSASMPFWGKYGGFDFVNWSNKFFIDSLLLYQKHSFSKIKEQELFVSNAFKISDEVVTETLSIMDKKYINCFKKYIKDENKKVLDIGCGRGVIINELSEDYKNIEFFGIDPVFESKNIKKGSVYSIKGKFDVIMAFEVLQHTYIDEALNSIYNALNPNGKIIVGERNPFSILGLLKPIYELKGKWMYPFDSPFREKWYSIKEWENLLKRHGFEIKHICYLDNEFDKVPKTNRYFFIVGERV